MVLLKLQRVKFWVLTVGGASEAYGEVPVVQVDIYDAESEITYWILLDVRAFHTANSPLTVAF